MTISAISEDEARAAAGAFIRRRLEASGLVQVEFARSLGLCQSDLSQMMDGHRRFSIRKINAVLEQLGARIAYRFEQTI